MVMTKINVLRRKKFLPSVLIKPLRMLTMIPPKYSKYFSYYRN